MLTNAVALFSSNVPWPAVAHTVNTSAPPSCSAVGVGIGRAVVRTALGGDAPRGRPRGCAGEASAKRASASGDTVGDVPLCDIRSTAAVATVGLLSTTAASRSAVLPAGPAPATGCSGGVSARCARSAATSSRNNSTTQLAVAASLAASTRAASAVRRRPARSSQRRSAPRQPSSAACNWASSCAQRTSTACICRGDVNACRRNVLQTSNVRSASS